MAIFAAITGVFIDTIITVDLIINILIKIVLNNSLPKLVGKDIIRIELLFKRYELIKPRVLILDA